MAKEWKNIAASYYELSSRGLKQYEREVLKKQFETAIKEAVKSCNELYWDELFPDFNEDVRKQLAAVKLSKNFEIAEFISKKNMIGSIMDKARQTFDWDSPWLCVIPDVE